MRITIIGSGNVATHLSAALKNAGHRIVQVYSLEMQNAALLAYHVGAEAIDNLKDINPQTDLFIIAVKDDAIVETATQLIDFDKIIAHTSGAVELEQLSDITPLAGVFYPLQTFSKTKEVSFREVPMCIEGADDDIVKTLEALARDISNSVYRISSAQRKVLHLSAVFACNFVNHLYGIGEELLKDSAMDFDLLRPLIQETVNKAMLNSPYTVQTGPAVRNDQHTMAAHLQLLKAQPHLQQIYEMLSQDIIKNRNKGYGDK